MSSQLFLQWLTRFLKFFLDEALAAGAYIVGTGRSDFPNQINNVGLPGIFRGALDARAKRLRLKCKLPLPKVLQN